MKKRELLLGVICLTFAGMNNALSAAFDKTPAPKLVVQTGHGTAVESVGYSADGKLVMSSANQSIKLWDVATGRELRTIFGKSIHYCCATLSPNSKSVLSGSEDGSLKLWDVATGGELRAFAGHKDRVTSIAISTDGNTAASASFDGTIKLWDLSTGRELHSISTLGSNQKNSPVYSIRFSPNDKLLAFAGMDKTVRLRDIATGRELHILTGHKKTVYSVAFSRDGNTLVSGSFDNTLKLWDTATGHELHTLTGHKKAVYSVAFSPDGQSVVSGSEDGTAKLWDVTTGQELLSFAENGSAINSIAFSPNGKSVALGSFDGAIKFWNLAEEHKKRSLTGQLASLYDVAFSPDSLTVAIASADNSIKLWSLVAGREIRTLAGECCITFSPDGQTLMSGSADNTLKLWDLDTGRVLRTFMGHKKVVTSIAISPDGKTVASGSLDKNIKLWDVSSGQELHTLSKTKNEIRHVAFSPNSKIVAAENGDGNVKLWDVPTGQELRTFAANGRDVVNIAFSPDGKTMAFSAWDDSIRLMNVDTGQELRSFIANNLDEPPVINANFFGGAKIAFSPDGKTVASAKFYDDNNFHLWDVATGKKLRTFIGHEDTVTGFAFSKDGKIIVSVSGDKTTKLWRVDDGSLLATLISFSDGRWAVTDTAGRFDVADLEDMPHLHWVMPDDPFTPLPIEIFMRDYYEPRLLQRILNGEKFKPVPALSKLNRVQPEIRITSITSVTNQADWIDISVEARSASRRYQPNSPSISTAVHDLRLFRNGQLVGYADGPLTRAHAERYRQTWRVHLPAGETQFTFSAYAFNDDHVKSVTTFQNYTTPIPIAAGKPNAWLINIGVNNHDNEAWNLNYAVNDALRIGESLRNRLQAQNKYQSIVTIPLISDGKKRLATKANIKAVLDRLAGKQVALDAIPNHDQLRRATPNDLVLISFSGHGINLDGQFYLIPSDIDTGQRRAINSTRLAHAISSDELAAWLRDVDGSDIAMIIDACQSAASVGNEFKPGPMGARGLGQLAYEKGMRILVASQEDEEAQESNLTQQGLLSYALVNDGLAHGKADFQPQDQKITLAEWLNYGVKRVPKLAQEVESGRLNDRGIANKKRGAVLQSDIKQIRALQQPSLFDFTKGRRNTTLTERVGQ